MISMKIDNRTIHFFDDHGVSALEHDELKRQNVALKKENERLKRMIRAMERKVALTLEEQVTIH